MPTTTTVERDRSIETVHALDVSGPDGRIELELATYHDKERKALITSLTYVEVSREDGYTIRHRIFDTPYVTLQAVPVARFNRRVLRETHTGVAVDLPQRLRDMASLGTSQSPSAARLLELLTGEQVSE